MNVNAIMACDEAGGIGNKGALPWPNNKEDMRWFRDLTDDGILIMGRKTWESIGSVPLPNRNTIVVTTSEMGEYEHLAMQGDMKKILETISDNHPSKCIWICGGAEIYSQAAQYCRNIYVTVFNGIYEADTFIEESTFKDHPLSAVMWKNEDLSFVVRYRKAGDV